MIVFLGIPKLCDLSSFFTAVSNLFVGFGLDKCLIWIILWEEALIPLVVTCSAIFTELSNMKNVVLDYG